MGKAAAQRIIHTSAATLLIRSRNLFSLRSFPGKRKSQIYLQRPTQRQNKFGKFVALAFKVATWQPPPSLKQRRRNGQGQTKNQTV
jgi:hypothetical protein